MFLRLYPSWLFRHIARRRRGVIKMSNRGKNGNLLRNYLQQEPETCLLFFAKDPEINENDRPHLRVAFDNMEKCCTVNFIYRWSRKNSLILILGSMAKIIQYRSFNWKYFQFYSKQLWTCYKTQLWLIFNSFHLEQVPIIQ